MWSWTKPRPRRRWMSRATRRESALSGWTANGSGTAAAGNGPTDTGTIRPMPEHAGFAAGGIMAIMAMHACGDTGSSGLVLPRHRRGEARGVFFHPGLFLRSIGPGYTNCYYGSSGHGMDANSAISLTIGTAELSNMRPNCAVVKCVVLI